MFKNYLRRQKQVKYVGGCREDQYCYDSLNEKNEAYCTSKIFQKTEGAQCYGSTECLSRMCMKNKCAALPDGLTCANHFECGNQSYCDDSHICQKIKKEGAWCCTVQERTQYLQATNGCRKMNTEVKTLIEKYIHTLHVTTSGRTLHG